MAAVFLEVRRVFQVKHLPVDTGVGLREVHRSGANAPTLAYSSRIRTEQTANLVLMSAQRTRWLHPHVLQQLHIDKEQISVTTIGT
jgi:hypothetical protein